MTPKRLVTIFLPRNGQGQTCLKWAIRDLILRYNTRLRWSSLMRRRMDEKLSTSLMLVVSRHKRIDLNKKGLWTTRVTEMKCFWRWRSRQLSRVTLRMLIIVGAYRACQLYASPIRGTTSPGCYIRYRPLAGVYLARCVERLSCFSWV